MLQLWEIRIQLKGIPEVNGPVVHCSSLSISDLDPSLRICLGVVPLVNVWLLLLGVANALEAGLFL